MGLSTCRLLLPVFYEPKEGQDLHHIMDLNALNAVIEYWKFRMNSYIKV